MTAEPGIGHQPRRPRRAPGGSSLGCAAGCPVEEVAQLLRELHVASAWVVVIGNGVAGLWALGAHWLVALRVRALWWFVAAVQVAVFVQVAFGVAMVAGEEVEVDSLHMFYGFLAIVAVGIMYSYRDQLRHRLYLLYGLGGLFLMGLLIRAMAL